MKVFIACLDQELLWAMDDLIGGLYSINLRTFEIEYVIDCQILFPHGRFEVRSLFAWKGNYLVIVPMEADKSWILYNKITGEIEYRRVIEQKCRESLIAADSERKRLYFLPLYRNDPILMVDQDTLTCTQMIENWSSRVPCEYLETAWKGAYTGRYLFFSIKNTRILVRMDCDSQKVDLLKLDLAENIIGVDYAFGELWVLPISGNRLYRIDESGLIVNTVELLTKDAAESLPCFARIVVQKKYLFLLPYYHKGIYIYDKQEGKIQIIPQENKSLEKKHKEVYLRYWEYCVRDNQICFLPYRDKYIEIDLDTLAYKEKGLSYPDVWSDEDKVWRNIWSHVSGQDSAIREADGCELNVFSEYIQQEIDAKGFAMYGCVGNRIWDMVKRRGRIT